MTPENARRETQFVDLLQKTLNSPTLLPNYATMEVSRRIFGMSLLAMATTPVGLIAYMRREANAYEVTRTQIAIKGLKKPLTLLHLSDLHASKNVSFGQLKIAFRQAISAVKPDLICLTGDYMTRHFPDPDAFRKTLTPLTDHAPTFAVVGNHDFTRKSKGIVSFRDMIRLLQSSGCEVLFNEACTFKFNGQALEIFGLGDIWSGTCRPHQVLNRLDEGPTERPPRIVLSHNPDSKATLKPYDWDLMLCGHTHGGQLRIPFTQIRPILPHSDQAYVEGRYDWDNRQIFITRGIGNQHGLRFNCRPEISVLNLVPKPA